MKNIEFNKSITRNTIILLLLFTLLSCKKLVEVDEFTDKMVSVNVFANEASSNAAINAIYRNLKSLASSITINNSLSSDDVINFSPVQTYDEYRTNNLQPSTINWSTYYSTIFMCNAAIEGLQKSTNITEQSKMTLLAEAKFNRAFCYFYLVNLWGNIPLVLTTDVNVSAVATMATEAQVYTQIIGDLQEAKSGLGNDYSLSAGEKIRANRLVASALLARVYLYQQKWNEAQSEVNEVINSGKYSLLNGPNGIFEKNNPEALLQWPNNSSESNSTITSNFIFTTTPQLICSDYLLNAFETGDRRKTTWISSKTYSNKVYYFPFKFTNSAATSTEWYTVMRLSELYLIRAEAKCMQADLQGAIDDINIIRSKHGGLTNLLAVPQTQAICLEKIMKERQVELFTEGCHRWFDLKRTGSIDRVMQLEKPLTWKSRSSLYPIPLSDILSNPKLLQNPGYQ